MLQTEVKRSPTSVGTTEAAFHRVDHLLWLCLGLAVAAIVYGGIAHHYLSPPAGYFFSGAIQEDQQYYMILSHAVFNLGNGIVYGNPFYLEPCTARYYSHLFILLVAWCSRLSSVDLDKVFHALGAVFCVGMYASLFYLVTGIAKDRISRNWTFLVAATGGSIGWLFALANFAREHNSSNVLSYIDQNSLNNLYLGGWWLDSTTACSIFPTECFYHCLMFLTLGTLARRRYKSAAIGVALLWWAHGIYGLEISAIAGLVVLLREVVPNWSQFKLNRYQYLPLVGAICIPAAYYLGYLPTIPEHSNIVTDWRTCLYKILAKYYVPHYHVWLAGTTAILLMLPFKRVRTKLLADDSIRFLAAFALGVFLMMNHNWFVTSTQPAHFSRGYLLLAFTLLSMRALTLLKVNFNSKWMAAALVTISICGLVDNGEMIRHFVYQPRAEVSWIPNSFRTMRAVLAKDQSNPLVLGDKESRADQQYLMRTGNLRTVVVHNAGPWFDQRVAMTQNFLKGKYPQAVGDYGINYLVATQEEADIASKSQSAFKLVPLVSDSKYCLYQISTSAKSAPAQGAPLIFSQRGVP